MNGSESTSGSRVSKTTETELKQISISLRSFFMSNIAHALIPTFPTLAPLITSNHAGGCGDRRHLAQTLALPQSQPNNRIELVIPLPDPMTNIQLLLFRQSACFMGMLLQHRGLLQLIVVVTVI